MVLSASSDDTNRGVLSNHLHSDGRYKDLLYVDGGPSISNQVGFLRMDGKGVFKHAVHNLSSAIIEAIDYNDLTIDDIDWFVPHQANIRILEAVSKKVGLSKDKVIITLDKHANTSAASIPLALYDAVQKDKIKKADLVLLAIKPQSFADISMNSIFEKITTKMVLSIMAGITLNSLQNKIYFKNLLNKAIKSYVG